METRVVVDQVIPPDKDHSLTLLIARVLTGTVNLGDPLIPENAADKGNYIVKKILYYNREMNFLSDGAVGALGIEEKIFPHEIPIILQVGKQ